MFGRKLHNTHRPAATLGAVCWRCAAGWPAGCRTGQGIGHVRQDVQHGRVPGGYMRRAVLGSLLGRRGETLRRAVPVLRAGGETLRRAVPAAQEGERRLCAERVFSLRHERAGTALRISLPPSGCDTFSHFLDSFSRIGLPAGLFEVIDLMCDQAG